MVDDSMTRQEFDQRTQNTTQNRLEEAGRVSDRTVIIERRISRLEELVTGEMGIIKSLHEVQAALQDVRDSLNRQAWVVPLITAIVTGSAVALVVKFIK
jgi:uncharacterized membrane protein YcjF (UPF0283 family)